MSTSSRNRVCDRCIRKKVKCDLQRPQCSRCLEASVSCTYSAERRKPGPPRGSRKPKATSASSASNEAQLIPIEQSGALSDLRVLGEDSPTIGHPSVPSFNASPEHLHQRGFETFGLDYAYSSTPPTSASTEHQEYPGYYLNRKQTRDILVHFFDEVHPALPLFRPGLFLVQYDRGETNQNLVVALVTLTAKILSPVSFWKVGDVDMCMRYLLQAIPLNENAPDHSLDSFRLEFILAYYAFHQSPGSKSWMRTSNLARRAYSVGLNQLDDQEYSTVFDAATATEDDKEDWRYLFWCIYCLDSYSNIPFGTPCVIELETISNALVRRPTHGVGQDLPIWGDKLFLPDDIEEIWETTKNVVSRGSAVDFNIHLIATTLIRQGGYIMRVRSSRKQPSAKAKSLQSAITAMRLSLPPRYLYPARNSLSGESPVDHHIRLANILLLQMSQFMIRLPEKFKEREDEWLLRWRESLEPCQNVVSVIEHWDSQLTPRIDPAICFIVFSVLNFLELHRRSIINPDASLIERLDHNQHLLLLFLEQFSHVWATPGFLLQQFKKSKNKSANAPPLTFAEIDHILRKFKSPVQLTEKESIEIMPTVATDSSRYLESATTFEDIWAFDFGDTSL
ncbi:hypothetical protein F5Y16DRAFT_366741 [Xylariaceae sp. FL0255]|nr:hypothetical protein F5Y16DRAFT_366741 [Xylariaceae sp. FL0255]